MDRIGLMNFFIRQRQYKRFLEISMHGEGVTFTHIRCARKVFYAHAASDFFKNEQEEFDIIFIDGIHLEDHVLADVCHSLRFLAKDGLIILHDCMPPDAWHQRDLSEFKEGENWNGTVWKAALRLFNQLEYKCTLLDTDWGCAIIDTSQHQQPALTELPESLNYDQHLPMLLAYKCSVADFMKEFVKVFFHVACMYNWKLVFEETMQQLHRNGFDNVNLTVLGTSADLDWIYNSSKGLSMNVTVIFHEDELANFEKPAMFAIENFAKENEGYVLYLHSKGVSSPNDITKAKWRRLMLKQLVDNWESCINQLADYDVIGVNWRETHPIAHFCGNFWYASTQYLRKLADFEQYYDNPRYRIWDSITAKRLGCEFWIGSSTEKPKVLSLFCKNVDFCNPAYWTNINVN
jgi:hypothetical protein